MLDAGARSVEEPGEEGGLVLFVGLVGNDRGDAAGARGGAVGLAGIALVADRGARSDVGSNGEQDGEMRRVGLLAAGQVESDQRAGCIGFGMDFGREAAT